MLPPFITLNSNDLTPTHNIYSTFNTFIKIMDVTAYTVKYIEQELPCELISWLSYIFFPAIIAVLSSFHIVVSGFTAIPIYFWTLVWHPDGRSIPDMLRNPEGNGRLIRYNNDCNRLRWRERSRPVPRWARRTRLRQIRMHMPNEKETLPIKGYDSRLCMFSYYQIHPTSIDKTAGGPLSEDGVTAKVSETMCYHSIRAGSCLSFGAKLLRKAHPKTPHRGFISSALVLISTLGILGILSIMACHRIYLYSSSSVGGGKSESSLQGIPGISEGNASIIGTSEGGTLGVSEGANAFGFTTSFADVDTEKLNTQIYFDLTLNFCL